MPITTYSHIQKRSKSEAMNGRVFLLLLLVGLIAAGGIFLATRDVPAPSHPVEKVIPNDRFLK